MKQKHCELANSLKLDSPLFFVWIFLDYYYSFFLDKVIDTEATAGNTFPQRDMLTVLKL